MDLKSCSRCGRIHPRGQECKRPRKRYERTEESALRSTNAWKVKSKLIREMARNLCEVCEDKGVYTYDNLEVHHIVKLSENKDGLLDDDNLVCLCTYHHKMADAGEIDADYLRMLARKRYEH